jgi:peptidoglycan/LPS O-acetylase OafA/YrhL
MSSHNPGVDRKIHFYFLDALRGIAAVWVVLFHAQLGDRLDHLSQFLPTWISLPVLEWGSLGVAIFFVLSGFVIAHSLRTARITFLYFRQFSLRRLARLTPPYYVSIVVTIAFALLASVAKKQPFTVMDHPLSIERLVAHLAYLQELLGFVNINDVYWTLCLEVQFYFLFCALLGLMQWVEQFTLPRSKTRLNAVSARIVVFLPVAVLSALFPLGILTIPGRATVFLPLWYSFLLGVFAYWAWNRRLSPTAFQVYAATLIIAGIVRQDSFAIVSVGIALLLLEVGRANLMQRLLKWQWIQFLGKISYSLYLTHTPVMGVVFFIGQKVLGVSVISDVVCLVGSLISCTGFAAAMWRFVEKPSISLSQRAKLPVPPQPSTVQNALLS